MLESTVAPLGGVWPGPAAVPSRVIGQAELLDVSGPVRASVAFVLVLLVGGGILLRYERLVDRSIDATLARPLASLGYGVAAHLVVGFAAFYLSSQLALLTVAGQNVGGIGVLVGAVLVLLTGGLGFTVVGAAIVDVWGGRNNWSGLVLGALIAGVVAVFDPLLAGVGWVAIVSIGIGGLARKWLHASAGPDD